ncbi:MAG: HypC/HybG/HupF family hydrogenase formation chaperone [Pseudomonadota bacterium]
MCLAVPSQVKAIEGSKAKIELGGITRNIDITLTPEVTVGDYVLVHTGYAISVIDEDEARETIELLEALVKND